MRHTHDTSNVRNRFSTTMSSPNASASFTVCLWRSQSARSYGERSPEWPTPCMWSSRRFDLNVRGSPSQVFLGHELFRKIRCQVIASSAGRAERPVGDRPPVLVAVEAELVPE